MIIIKRGSVNFCGNDSVLVTDVRESFCSVSQLSCVMMAEDMGTKVASAIKFAEKVLLVVIALLTVFATLEVNLADLPQHSGQLADLLLLLFLPKC